MPNSNTIKYNGVYCPCRWTKTDDLQVFYQGEWITLMPDHLGD